MKLRKLLFSTIPLTTLIGSTTILVSCNNAYDKVEKLEVGTSTETLEVTKTLPLQAKIYPEDLASKVKVVWSVTNTDDTPTTKATINESTGLLTAIDVGSVKVKVTLKGYPDKFGTKIITIPGYDKESTPEEYIYNRTFTMNGTGKSTLNSNGTFWILSDATPDMTDDYKYWICTNWHVRGQLEFASDLKYATGKGYLKDSSAYTAFDSIVWEDNLKMTYDGQNDDNAIDLSVAKVDMASATGEAKEKLENLNKIQNSRGFITPLANTSSLASNYCGMKLYESGFPVLAEESTNDSYPKWTYNEISPNTLAYSLNITTHSMEYYPTSTSEVEFAWDVAPQYYYEEALNEDWAVGGASGSMLIGDFGEGDNHLYKVIGIYWGFFRNEQEVELNIGHPCFSVFNHKLADGTTKNFLKDYVIY